MKSAQLLCSQQPGGKNYDNAPQQVPGKQTVACDTAR